MLDFDYLKARRLSEMNEALLRGVLAERQKLLARLNVLQGQVAGARAVIAQKESQIQRAEPQVAALQADLERLERQERELRLEQSAGKEKLAG